MAPRANWKGYLKLSLVSCAIVLYPATSAAGRISFHTLNRKSSVNMLIRKAAMSSNPRIRSRDMPSGRTISLSSRRASSMRSNLRAHRPLTLKRLFQPPKLTGATSIRPII
jgi:hypothetical protein